MSENAKGTRAPIKSSVWDRIGGLFPFAGHKIRKSNSRPKAPTRQVVIESQVPASDYVKATAVYPNVIKLDDCHFYHTMTFPDGTVVEGDWDFRESFSDYIGRVDVSGRMVLDAGTASGFVAFETERRGAKVLAYELDSGASVHRVPFKESVYYNDKKEYLAQFDAHLRKLKKGFWYAHSKYRSNVSVVYGRLLDLDEMVAPVDVVIAGALVEHLSDPITGIGKLAKVAKEKLVIASTPLIDSDDLLMKPINSFDNYHFDFTWFALSRGMMSRVLENVGFRVTEITAARQFFRIHNAWVDRPTIVAERI